MVEVFGQWANVFVPQSLNVLPLICNLLLVSCLCNIAVGGSGPGLPFTAGTNVTLPRLVCVCVLIDSYI